MTQPNPDDAAKAAAEKAAAEKAAAEKAAAEKAAAEKAAATVARYDVVGFTHHDVLTGRDVETVGVVVRAEKGEQTVSVRPLASHHVDVDRAAVTVLSGD